MQEIGIVSFVQIQRSQMKVGEGTKRIYRPDPLLTVDQLWLTAAGIMGLDAAGAEQMDVHHEHHPESRFRGDNKISLGFLPHYASMRQRFGDHMRVGVAGENILIDITDLTWLAAPTDKLIIEHQADHNQIELIRVIPAPPCREFSQFCTQRDLSPAELKDTLQFLSHGRRGFYAELVEKDCRCLVSAGDRLFAL